MVNLFRKGLFRCSFYFILLVEFILSTFAGELSGAKCPDEYFKAFGNVFTCGNCITMFIYTVFVIVVGEIVKGKLDSVSNGQIKKKNYPTKEEQLSGDKAEPAEEIMKDLEKMEKSMNPKESNVEERKENKKDE